MDDTVYPDVEQILEQIQYGCGYSASRPTRSRTNVIKMMNHLIEMGWRTEYVTHTFGSRNDTTILGWPNESIFIEQFFKGVIQRQGYVRSLRTSFLRLGLREDVAARLESILSPLLGSSYTHTQILDVGIEYLLEEYNPTCDTTTTHDIETLSISTWIPYTHRYTHNSTLSKPIMIYKIPYPCQSSRVDRDFRRALLSFPYLRPHYTFYFHATSWENTLNILYSINRFRGRHCLDFGIFPGFYLSCEIDDCIRWCVRNRKRWRYKTAVLLFYLPDTLPSHLAFKHLTDTEWTNVTKESRECLQKQYEIRTIKEYDLIYGDMVSNPEEVKENGKLPVPHAPPKAQLVGRTDRSDRFLHKCLVGCVYFQK
jgi:hypothetical protein